MTQEKTPGTGAAGTGKPEKKFRAGAISATVWKNAGQTKEGKPTAYRTISLNRGYKDKNEQWQNTTSMRINDLPRVMLVMRQAYEYLVTAPTESNESIPNLQEEVVM